MKAVSELAKKAEKSNKMNRIENKRVSDVVSSIVIFLEQPT